MKLFIALVFLGLLCSCGPSTKEKAYDAIAAEFCNCYNGSNSVSVSQKYSECMKRSIALHKDDLIKIGIKEGKEYGDMVNNLISNSRIKKYCPTFMTDLISETKRAKSLIDTKLRFIGTFVNQEKVGIGTRNLYEVQFKSDRNSIFRFLSTYPLELEELSGKRTLIVYHEEIDSTIWIDSISTK